jgi:hypothetical protein
MPEFLDVIQTLYKVFFFFHFGEGIHEFWNEIQTLCQVHFLFGEAICLFWNIIQTK